MKALELRKLKKQFGDTKVLRGIDLTVEEGEFCVLLGPSGCGKSTALRCIAGLEDSTSGEVMIHGKSVNGFEPKDRDIAMVFQSYALYPHMTARANMEFPLKMQKLSDAEIKNRVGEAADFLQIESLLDRKPGELSGGQRQRVAIGRAIVRKPKLFLFDEPLSNLDAKLRHEMRIELARIHKKLGASMIYVTHDQVEAMTLADRIAVMNNGKIDQIGTPSEIYSKPKTRFVAGFVGMPSMNFVKGLQNNPNEQGVRSEHIDLNGQDYVATVEFVENLGADRYAYLQYESQRLVARIPIDLDLKTGQAVHFSIRPEHMHAFA